MAKYSGVILAVHIHILFSDNFISVSVPVLSCTEHPFPRTFVLLQGYVQTLCLDMETAPLAKVEVMITGSISGVSPTAR